MARKYALDLIRELGSLQICYDEDGREVPDVRWIDDEAGEFGQIVRDEKGTKQRDPENRDQVWTITRYGRLTLYPRRRSGNTR